jgi:hypothetical protein
MDIGKKILLFITQAAIYSAIFWSSWIFVFKKISDQHHEEIPLISNNSANELDKIYEQQLRKTEAQLIAVDGQQKRMEKLLEKYEDHAQRYEKVLQKWEQQTALSK